MAEDAGKKEEEKLEFDSMGQAIGYISLDQARVLALQHARDNREFYGRSYAQRDLVWEELNAEESEDYYRIRLSYRPARGFRGQPGVEQFTFDKAGPIELREILSEPRRSHGFVVALVGMIAVLLAAGGATIGGLFASGAFSSSDTEGAASGPITVSIQNQSAVTLVSQDGSVSVDVSAGSVDAAAQLTFRQLSPADIPVLPATFQATGKVFDLTTGATLLKPISITVQVSAADAVLANGDEANIVIQHHRDGAWTLLDTTVDFGESIATAQVDRLSIFALTIKQPEPTQAAASTPPTITPAPEPTPTLTPVPTSTPMPTPAPTTAPLATPPPAPTTTATPLPAPAALPIATPTRAPTPTPNPIGTAPLEGRLLYDGRPISDFTQSSPTFLVRGRSQQQVCADVDGMPWDQVAPEIDSSGSTYSLSDLNPGHYCFWVTIDASEPFDGRDGRPGDYASGHGYGTEVVLESGRLQTLDLRFYRWMRLTSPVDTSNIVVLEGQPPDNYRTLASPFLVSWEEIPEAVRYGVNVVVCPLSGCMDQQAPIFTTVTLEMGVELDLPPSQPGEKYWMNVGAFGRTSQIIGEAWVAGPISAQGGLPFRISMPGPTPIPTRAVTPVPTPTPERMVPDSFPDGGGFLSLVSHSFPDDGGFISEGQYEITVDVQLTGIEGADLWLQVLDVECTRAIGFGDQIDQVSLPPGNSSHSLTWTITAIDLQKLRREGDVCAVVIVLEPFNPGSKSGAILAAFEIGTFAASPGKDETGR